MSSAIFDNPACRSEEVAAYLDGELDAAAAAAFEQHLSLCRDCSGELLEQRRLLCTLDFALKGSARVELPKNFAAVVTAHAQSDMRGLSLAAERGRALRLCAALCAASFVMLGGAAFGNSVFEPVRFAAKSAISLFAFVGRALYDAGAGVAIISRGVGGHLIFESYPGRLLSLLLLVLAVVLLSRLLVRHQRTRPVAR
ncbi:MAG TPA: zf-HC2 domain-containing protein [Pyrinomonadaceae bacterium]